MQAESPEEVPFIVRPEPLPFLLACVAAAAGAAAAVFYGATLAAVAWLAAALVLERVSRRAVPLPDDILAFAPPTNVLGGGDGSGGGKGSAGEERLSQAIQTVMRQQIAAGTQIGMAVAVYYKGRNVAHVCGGVFRPMGGGGGGDAWKAVDANTLFMSYSVCKGVAAAGLMTCIDRGECAYADPVVDAWPSFDKTGEKHSVTIADAVSHRAGMPGLRPSFLPVVAAHLFRDWHSAWRTGLAFIEDYSPEWTPGTQAQYHYVSFSWIIGGIIEHASRLHIHQLVRDRIEAPLGEAGRMFVGLLPSAALDRAARLECPPRYPLLPDGWDAGGEREEMDKAGWVGEWMRLVVGWIESSVFVEAGNSALWRKVCLPSSNGFFTAGAAARMYGALTNGGALDRAEGNHRIVSPATVAEVVESWKDTVPTRGEVRAGKSQVARRALGFSPWLDERVAADADTVCTLSHFGMGSCVAFGEVETGLAIAVLKNAYEPVATVGGSLSPDVAALIQAIRQNVEP